MLEVVYETVSRQLSEGGVLSGYGELSDPLSLFFVQATIILGFCRVLGLLGTYLNQPKVIFEIIAGVLLVLPLLAVIRNI